MPRTRPSDPRHHVVATRLTSALFSKIAQHAQRNDITLSAAILSVIDNHFNPPSRAPVGRPSLRLAIKPMLRRAIDEHGHHLNAIARAVNAHDAPPPGDLQPLIQRLAGLIDRITALAPPAGTLLLLAPATYHSLNRVAVNLRQIEARLRLYGFAAPHALAQLRTSLCRFLDRADTATP